MSHSNKVLSGYLGELDLGSSVAEYDSVLEASRIETSAFTDLLLDRVDLVPGTKGSGKSALFRMFVDFLPGPLLTQRKVVIAHGIESPGDPVFHAFSSRFEELTEQEFVSFWCIYLVSLANEQFVRGDRYKHLLKSSGDEIKRFQEACMHARIPEIEKKKSLKEILEWSLNVLTRWRPKIKVEPPGELGALELDLFGSSRDASEAAPSPDEVDPLPTYINDVKSKLEAILASAKLSLWLMVDRLDEIFPRRSNVERNALRGLLRASRYFVSSSIRIKIFLRDDMLEQVVLQPEGFTALTHITARQADTLRWNEEQILTMIVKRFCANKRFTNYLAVNKDKTDSDPGYRKLVFEKIFPPTVFKGPKQSSTIRWICNRCADGRGVVTPRDVLDLVIRAKQRQADILAGDPDGTSDHVIGPEAVQYGFEELSKKKKNTYLQAEFPHLWSYMDAFTGGKTEYSAESIQAMLGKNWQATAEHLIAVGFFSKRMKGRDEVYSIPYVYWHCMNLTRGKMRHSLQ